MTVLFNFFQPKADGWRGPEADERGVTGADGRGETGADGMGGTCRKKRNRPEGRERLSKDKNIQWVQFQK